MRRRDFLKNGAVALTAAATKPLFAWQGANNRVRMAVIGMGGRSGRVFDSFTRYDDVQFTMGCEVNADQSGRASRTIARSPQPLNVVGDYRRVLDRNDIDAVLDRHARLLACQDHGRRTRRGQARVRREADLEQHRAHQHDARRLQQVSESRRCRSARSSGAGITSSKPRTRWRSSSGVTHVLIQQPGGVFAEQAGGRAGAGRARLGCVAGGRAEEAVQARVHVVPRLVGVRQRPRRRLGRPPHRRRELVHERRQQAAAQDDGGRVLLEPEHRSGVRVQRVLDRLAVRQLHHDVRQQRLSAAELCRSRSRRTSRAGASTSTPTTGRCRSTAWAGRSGRPSAGRRNRVPPDPRPGTRGQRPQARLRWRRSRRRTRRRSTGGGRGGGGAAVERDVRTSIRAEASKRTIRCTPTRATSSTS